jgi:hypothetical protein
MTIGELLSQGEKMWDEVGFAGSHERAVDDHAVVG